MYDFNDKELAKKRLQELQDLNIPKMTLQKLIETKQYEYLKLDLDCATQAEIQAANDHLSSYCEQGYNEDKDIFSNEKCHFYFGLRHGEMETNDNGLERKYYHYLTLGGKRHRVEMLLQYHPSEYSID